MQLERVAWVVTETRASFRRCTSSDESLAACARISLVHGKNAPRACVRCEHNNSNAAVLWAKIDGKWTETPSVEMLRGRKRQRTQCLVEVVLLVPLVGAKVAVVASLGVAGDDASGTTPPPPLIAPPVYQQQPYDHTQTRHALMDRHTNLRVNVTAMYVTKTTRQDEKPLNVASTGRWTWTAWYAALLQFGSCSSKERWQCEPAAVLSMVKVLLPQGGASHLLMRKGEVFFQTNRKYRRRVCDDCANEVVVSEENASNVVTFNVATGETTEHGDVGTCEQTRQTGCDMFSEGGTDPVVTDKIWKRVQDIAHNKEQSTDGAFLHALLGGDALPFLQTMNTLQPECEPKEFVRQCRRWCSLEATGVANWGVHLWWPKKEYVVFAEDDDKTIESTNEAAGYKVWQWDSMSNMHQLCLDAHEAALVQLIPGTSNDDMMQLWCIPTGTVTPLSVTTKHGYENDDINHQVPTEPMVRKHVHFVPGGLRGLSVMVKDLGGIPFTACVTTVWCASGCVHRAEETREGDVCRHCGNVLQFATCWTMQTKREVARESSDAPPSIDWENCATSLPSGGVPRSLVSDDNYRVSARKVWQLMCDPLNAVVSMLTLQDTRVLMYNVHKNASYLCNVKFPNRMLGRVDNETKRYVFKDGKRVSAKGQFCAVCAPHMDEVVGADDDDLCTRALHAISSGKLQFTSHGVKYEVCTKNGHMCVVHEEGGAIVWQDKVSKEQCQLCRFKAMSGAKVLPPQVNKEYADAGSSVMESLFHTILQPRDRPAATTTGQHDVRRTMHSTMLLQGVLAFLLSDDDAEEEAKQVIRLEHLAKNVFFPGTTVASLCPRGVVRNQTYSMGNGFHIEHQQLLLQPLLLLLTQVCMVSLLRCYVGSDTLHKLDRHGRVSHNMARAAVLAAFRRTVVGTNVVEALLRTAKFLDRYVAENTPTHVLRAVVDQTMQYTKRVLPNIFPGEEDIVPTDMRAHVAVHVLRTNLECVDKVFDALPSICASTSSTLLDELAQACVWSRPTREHNDSSSDMSDVPDMRHDAQPCGPVKSSKNSSDIECRLFITDTAAPQQLFYAKVRDGTWQGCPVARAESGSYPWCHLCQTEKCEHHMVLVHQKGCAKCGQLVDQVGSPVDGASLQQRLLDPLCAIQSNTGRLHIAQSVHEIEQSLLPVLVQAGRGRVSVPALVCSGDPSTLDAVGRRSFPHQHTRHKFHWEVHKQVSAAVTVGPYVFSKVLWARWCAAIASGSDNVAETHHAMLQQGRHDHSSTANTETTTTTESMLATVASGGGWRALWEQSFRSVECMRKATDLMLMAQRCCVLNAQAVSMDCAGGTMRSNVMQVARWMQGVAEVSATHALRQSRDPPRHTQITSSAKQFVLQVAHLHVVAGLHEHVLRNCIVDTKSVADTVHLEFLRFLAWLLHHILRVRYHPEDGTDATNVSALDACLSHMDPDRAPCVQCLYGTVCATSGTCNRCGTYATRFAVPFGCSGHGNRCYMFDDKAPADTEAELCEIDPLPNHVQCSNHTQFKAVWRALLKRWQGQDGRLLRDMLACAAPMHSKDTCLADCVSVQFEAARWQFASNSEMPQCLRQPSVSLQELAALVLAKLVPQPPHCVLLANKQAAPDNTATSRIWPLNALKSVAAVLVHYEAPGMLFVVSGVTAGCRDALSQTGVHERLRRAADALCVTVLNEIERRLTDHHRRGSREPTTEHNTGDGECIVHPSTRQPDPSVLNSIPEIVDTCVRMCLDGTVEQEMYLAYRDLVQHAQRLWHLLPRHDAPFVFFAVNPDTKAGRNNIVLTTGTLLDFVNELPLLALLHVRTTTEHPTTRTRRLKDMHNAMVISTRQQQPPCLNEERRGTTEDNLFIQIAGGQLREQVDVLMRPRERVAEMTALVRKGKFLHTGACDHVLSTVVNQKARQKLQ